MFPSISLLTEAYFMKCPMFSSQYLYFLFFQIFSLIRKKKCLTLGLIYLFVFCRGYIETSLEGLLPCSGFHFLLFLFNLKKKRKLKKKKDFWKDFSTFLNGGSKISQIYSSCALPLGGVSLHRFKAVPRFPHCGKHGELDTTQVFSLGFNSKAHSPRRIFFGVAWDKSCSLLSKHEDSKISTVNILLENSEYILCPCPCPCLSVQILTFSASLSSPHTPGVVFVIIYAAQRLTPTSLQLRGWLKKWSLPLLTAL